MTRRGSASRARSPESRRGAAAPRAGCDTRYKWAYIFGAACRARAKATGLVMAFADIEAMNAHHAEIARTVAPGAQLREISEEMAVGSLAKKILASQHCRGGSARHSRSG